MVSSASLEADGLISVYDLETARVIAEYEGLEVHDLVCACLRLHRHEHMEKVIDSEHVIVDEDAWTDMVNALRTLAGKIPWMAPRGS